MFGFMSAKPSTPHDLSDDPVWRACEQAPQDENVLTPEQKLEFVAALRSVEAGAPEISGEAMIQAIAARASE